MKVFRKFALVAFASLFLLSATLEISFITQVTCEQTISSGPIESFPLAGKFYTLAGRSFNWAIINGETVATGHSEEIHKWSVQDIVGDVALVNRTYVDSYIQPQTGENYTGTEDFDYQIATNRTILSAYWEQMSFTTTGFKESDGRSLNEDVGEHTWAWFPTNLAIGASVNVSWTWDSRFLNDMQYEIVGEESIEVLGEKQDCWMLRMPPSNTIDGTQRRTETYWVDKDTGVPLKLYGKGWVLDGSSGFEDEYVLVHTNIDLGPESTQPPSPTYTLTVPTTPGFPKAGKFWSWYVLEVGWNMRDASNVSYYQEGLLTRWVANVTNDDALVYKIFFGDYLCDVEDVKELEAVDILYTIYRANTTTREILEAISSLIYHVNMTSLTYEMTNRTSLFAGDVGEETYCWLPTNIHIGAKVNITWSYDRPWTLDNATYTVIDEKILSALGEPQACWVLYLPPTTSIDSTWNYSETYYSDKDVGIPLGDVEKGWAVDSSSAWVDNLWLMDTNIYLGPPYTYYLTITSTAGGTTNPLPGTYNYTAGSSLNVTAIPNTGYSFDYWLLDEEERTANPITVIMDANHTLEAVFADIPPVISITSPENKTYTVNNVSLTFTVSESTSWIGYSLDGKANVTIAGNTTLSGLTDGSHSIIVYANDTAGNMRASAMIYFSVSTQGTLFLWIAVVIVIIVVVAVLVYWIKVKRSRGKVK